MVCIASCVVSENIHTPPMEDHWKFPGEGMRARNFQGKRGLTLNCSFQTVRNMSNTRNNEKKINLFNSLHSFDLEHVSVSVLAFDPSLPQSKEDEIGYIIVTS